MPSRIATIILLLVICPVSKAQTVNVKLTDGVRKWWEPLPVKHRTADTNFWTLTSVGAILTAGDVENSLYAFRSRPGTRELNPLYGSHPGRARYYAIAAPLAGICSYYSWKYKREDDALKAAGIPGHRFVKWWIPEALNAGAHALGIVFTLSNTGY